VRARWPDYHAAPVPSFGVRRPGLLVVGLAPGLHGANASGRPFTGDYAGEILYPALHRHGFASAPVSTGQGDGLRLLDCRITNAVRCLPPQNRPTGEEVRCCNPFLVPELSAVRAGGILLALGRIAHDAILRAIGARISSCPFAHGGEHALPGGLRLLDSYHCSRYNINTRRLTPEMFDEVMARARALLGSP
jgi:uracil-DNA glycosylase